MIWDQIGGLGRLGGGKSGCSSKLYNLAEPVRKNQTRYQKSGPTVFLVCLKVTKTMLIIPGVTGKWLRKIDFGDDISEFRGFASVLSSFYIKYLCTAVMAWADRFDRRGGDPPGA